MRRIKEGEWIYPGFKVFVDGYKETPVAVGPTEVDRVEGWLDSDWLIANIKPREISEHNRKQMTTAARMVRHGYRQSISSACSSRWVYHEEYDTQPQFEEENDKPTWPMQNFELTNCTKDYEYKIDRDHYLTNPCTEVILQGGMKHIDYTLGEDNMPKKTDLYEIEQELGTKVFGTYLATNSDGKYVFEIKGSGEFLAVDKDKAERVMPYTVDIQFLTAMGGSSNGKQYAYLCEKGKVSKGDLLIVNNGLAKVVDVDTKSEFATTELTGYKLQTETI